MEQFRLIESGVVLYTAPQKRATQQTQLLLYLSLSTCCPTLYNRSSAQQQETTMDEETTTMDEVEELRKKVEQLDQK